MLSVPRVHADCLTISLAKNANRARFANARAFAIDVGAHTTAAGVLDATAGAGVSCDDRRARISTAEVISGSDRVKGMR